MSLRSRLIVSYIVIIVVSLSLAFFTLLALARPMQNRLTRLRLIVQSRQVATQINTLSGRGISTEKILARLDSWAIQNQTRLVMIDPQGTILADSQDTWVGQPVFKNEKIQPRRADQNGTIEVATGDTYLYAAAPLGPTGQPTGYVVAVTTNARPLAGLLAELGEGFLAAGGVALLVSLLLGVLIARSMARPLQRIAQAAGAVAAGDYEHRLAEQGPPEVKRVAASFNVMVGRVESSQQAMRDFVSNVSHELKTPLTSIQGFSQAIMEGATQDEATQHRAAGIIHQEAGRMARLVEDLLDLARLDSGQVVMNKTQLDLGQILNSTVERLLPQAVHKRVKLVKQGDTLPPMRGDGDRLAQVFTNLLDNAIRHTPQGGQVTLSSRVARGLPRPRRVRPGLVRPDATTALSERGDFVEVSLTDTGPGIPPADLARIFERFYQVDKSRKREHGAGLGLAIAKEIVEAHGGYLRAESEAGAGAKFTVILPLTEANAHTLISARR